ncbi:MAG TPA: VWA domain-containing protein [Candidatus Tyrphobacter sp.]
MTLAHPLRFAVALVVAAVLALLYGGLARRKTVHDLAYSHLAFFVAAVKPRAWVPRALHAVWVVALIALAVAVGGPRITAPVPVRDGAVFVCIDTSGSMAAGDVAPTRAAAALLAARAFIDESAPGTRIGVISFSSGASMVQPLSSDHAAVRAALASVPPPNGATAIGDALRLAASALPATGYRLIVLITDGVNNMGADPQQIAQWLGTQHIPVYTVGIGTANGGVIPGSSDEATIDEGALRSYAQVSGGAYARAQNATQLRDALAHLGRVASFERKPVDASAGFAVMGVVLLIATFLAGFGIGRFV